MFNRLVENMGRASTLDDNVQMHDPENQLAAAILLYAVLPADNVVVPQESLELRFSLQHHFRVSDQHSRHLISRAVSAHALEPSLVASATILKHRFTLNFRRHLLNSAHRIAMSDGRLHDNEIDVLSRISSLLGLNAPSRDLRMSA